jgi:hypothetical protein
MRAKENAAMSVTDLLESMGTAGEAVGARGEFMVPVADPVALRSHFAQEGYVVVRHAVPGSLCQAALAAFERDVKPSRAYFKRHASSDKRQGGRGQRRPDHAPWRQAARPAAGELARGRAHLRDQGAGSLACGQGGQGGDPGNQLEALIGRRQRAAKCGLGADKALAPGA